MPGDSITLPDKGDLTRSGYVFGGWNTSSDGKGTNYAVGSYYKPTGNNNLYAKWIAQYTVTFNANGGTVSPTSGVTGVGSTLSSLPDPDPTEKNAGDIFVGWYMAAWGGTAVTTSTVFSGNATIYAQWKFTDSRDSKTYKKVKIGNQTWMAENLNYNTNTTGSVCYDNNSNHCAEYGRLYTWEDAKDACPKGWELPSYTGWTTLVSSVGSSSAANKLRSTSGWDGGSGTDDYGFSALPGGYGRSSGFSDIGTYGYWWSATEYTNITGAAYYRSISGYNMYSSYAGKTDLYSVRCEQK
jgi:uncharacterized protein (TIGR02145 family)/uncharacterized repeat protein (TIGR02543 family)